MHSFVWGGLVISRGAVANNLNEIVFAAAKEGANLQIFYCQFLQVIQLVYQRIFCLVDAHRSDSGAKLFTFEQA